MENWHLDEILEHGDVVVLSNSKYIITWNKSKVYQRWDRSQREDEYFFSDAWTTVTVDEDHARAIACAYALGQLGK